jgi:hypothetical protein
MAIDHNRNSNCPLSPAGIVVSESLSRLRFGTGSLPVPRHLGPPTTVPGPRVHRT